MARPTWSEIKAQRAADDPALENKAREVNLRLDLAQFVYELRTKAALTQTELAKRMGTTQSAIARLEGGGMNPTAEQLQRLGVALDIQIVLMAEHVAGLPPVVISDAGSTARASWPSVLRGSRVT